MDPRLAAVIATIVILLSLGGIIWIQGQQLDAANGRIVELEDRLASAQATIAIIEGRLATDAEVQSMPPAKVREEMQLWVR